MLSYLLMYFIPAVAAIFHATKSTRKNAYPLVLAGIAMAFLVGFRDRVGGDWNNYLRRFSEAEFMTFAEALMEEDPAYWLLNVLMSDWGWGIYGVNFVGGVLFTIGLMAFISRQTNPWLGLTVAVPYLIIVVSMGYTRQGVAVGLVLWGITALEQGKFKRFIVLVALATAFHKSAVLMIGLGLFQKGKGKGKGKFIRILAVTLAGLGIFDAFLADHSEELWENYVEAQMQSEGAKIRVLMNLVPSVVFFLFRKRWKKHYSDYPFWFIIAVGSVASVFLVGSASTAVDRVALYFIPIQIVVFSRLPFLAQHIISQTYTTVMIVLFYALVLLVWLNYATNARYWVPYDNLLFLSF